MYLKTYVSKSNRWSRTYFSDRVPSRTTEFAFLTLLFINDVTLINAYICRVGGSSLRITANMICSGVSGTVLSGCHGDSGGPYVCQNPAGNWVLQGAVSWGSPRCSANERYTVFARVAKFRNWFDQMMRT